MQARARMVPTFRQLALLVMLATLSACGSDRSNPLSPAVQPEVINNADAFSFQVTGVQNASATLDYSWQNTGTVATVNQSASISVGSATLIIRDAAGTQVYSRSLSDNGTFASTAGVAGTWTIRVVFSAASGTINFRSDKG
ncbi:MAG TPA: hypothetical protein VH638_07330 [Gemmatimonadaceae bacterium]